jgi:hypothetical protein
VLFFAYLGLGFALLGSANLAGMQGTATPDPWINRSGEAEALADLAAGAPVKLYTHVWGGEGVWFRTPGLLYCDPDRNSGDREAQELFAEIPDANMSEGVILPADRQSRQLHAFLFAQTYNLTMFERRRDDVVRFCPGVQLEKK